MASLNSCLSRQKVFPITSDIDIFGIIRDLLFYLENDVVCTYENGLSEVILMSTHNILLF